jgi:transposase
LWPGDGALLRLRELTVDEGKEIARLAKSRSDEARLVERARIVALAAEGTSAPAIARALGISAKMARQWLRRFNAAGLAGLADAPRSGRPVTYTAEVVGQVIAASLTKPQDLGLPFASWTLDRLAAYMQEERGVAIKRGRIDQLLLAEGLRWRRQETWFSERAAMERPGEDARGATPVDPAFAQKRGPSSPAPRRRQARAP